MDLAYKQEATVGTLVIAAVVLFFVGTTWLSGRSVGRNSDKFYKIQFGDASNLKASSAVRISGVSVGKVENIQLADVGKVIISVSLPEKIQPRIDASASVVAVGFVGDAAIEFDPGKAAEPLPRSHIIIGSMKAGLTDRAAALGDRADSVLLGAQAIVNQKTADELYETMNALQATLKATQRTMLVLSDTKSGPSAELTRTMVSFRALSDRLDSTLANPALARTLGRADTLTGNLARMTAQLTTTTARLDSVLAGVNSGRGSLGKFATDTGFYTDVRQLSQSMKRLLDELQKHPGKVPVTVKLF
ncbi:MAG TPA: MlaD family protein [Gemmatimonadales bacterium]|jgi:phospholipid/cholesterol/gamma-HCH transport system substrate-binding protein|nr:MlaD family protein [Gemmatimonadales bacterium]